MSLYTLKKSKISRGFFLESPRLCLLIIDTDICKIPGYPLLKCQKVVADRFSEVDGEWLLRRSSSLVNPALYFVTGEKF
ncbi:hypothetical protein AVEN_97379-1 [Araneus ventricosus]|uniref:Uncharacterized protein n=1 Tax=Araneus ventricosus TaxID=182803 RepID=A0A4Y2WNJ6_ARAVE|nr:hypothetical protein AVEN_97379-1 [Araneus ventricosus]